VKPFLEDAEASTDGEEATLQNDNASPGKRKEKNLFKIPIGKDERQFEVLGEGKL